MRLNCRRCTTQTWDLYIEPILSKEHILFSRNFAGLGVYSVNQINVISVDEGIPLLVCWGFLSRQENALKINLLIMSPQVLDIVPFNLWCVVSENHCKLNEYYITLSLHHCEVAMIRLSSRSIGNRWSGLVEYIQTDHHNITIYWPLSVSY